MFANQSRKEIKRCNGFRSAAAPKRSAPPLDESLVELSPPCDSGAGTSNIVSPRKQKDEQFIYVPTNTHGDT